jgi:hypothetical protein
MPEAAPPLGLLLGRVQADVDASAVSAMFLLAEVERLRHRHQDYLREGPEALRHNARSRRSTFSSSSTRIPGDR